MMLDLNDIRIAAGRLVHRARITPLLESEALNAIAKTRVFIKAESLQKGGAFKFRGAMNKMLTLTEQVRRRGVVAFSSGNHALAVALAARELGIDAVVLMPRDAPLVKVEGARCYGAEVIFYDRVHDDREAMCATLVAERGLTLVPPYDDFSIMAGAGTSALEAIEQLPSGVEIDHVAVCCSGGGLTAGWSTVVRELIPDARILAVEPQDFDDTGQSLRAGSRVSNVKLTGTICDALVVVTPGQLTFNVMEHNRVQGMTVTDGEVCHAVKFAFTHLKLVLEPSGAAALAAVLAGKLSTPSKGILLIASGGNVDHDTFVQCIRN